MGSRRLGYPRGALRRCYHHAMVATYMYYITTTITTITIMSRPMVLPSRIVTMYLLCRIVIVVVIVIVIVIVIVVVVIVIVVVIVLFTR